MSIVSSMSSVSGTAMTGLFRPWAEVVVLEKGSCLHQDSTVSTTTVIEQLNATQSVTVTDDPSSREVKYKNVKEHIRKRNEKYLQKKVTRKEPDLSTPCHFGPTYQLPPPELPVLSSFCCPPDVKFGTCGEFGFASSPELLETALSQGLPPTLVEEYARLLTEQQRHISERNRKQRPKKFRCPHCQVGFSNNGQLKGHIRIHTGERPFKCDAESCGKSFTRNEELTRHRRIHSGLRPFPCPECGKRFGRKDHLKKHVKTHFQQRFQLVPILPSHYPYLYGF